MARTGRPKVEKPINRVVTVKFREEEYQLMLEYAQNHNAVVKPARPEVAAGPFLQERRIKDGL